MTQRMPSPYGEPASPPPERRSRVPLRFWLLGLLLLAIVLITATGGIRDWWAHRLHDMTGGNKAPDYLIGLGVGLLPLLAVVLGSVRSRGHGRIRRAWRMFWFGAAGFVVTYLLSPSLTRLITDSAARRVFDEQAPSYLAGVLTGTVAWIALLVLFVIQARRRRRSGPRRRPPVGLDDEGKPHRIVDV